MFEYDPLNYDDLDPGKQVSHSHEEPPLLENESANYRIGEDILVREVKAFDQYSDEFKPIIKEFNTSSSICGYYSTALCPILAEWTQYLVDLRDLNETLSKFNDSSLISQLLREPMGFINRQRTKYVQEHFSDFKTDRDRQGYITDWVANYEISDYFKEKAKKEKISNLFFFRQNPFNYPDEILKMKHEELHRLKEEEKFKGEPFILERFSPQQELIFINDFKEEKVFQQLTIDNKPIVLVGDLAGHFVSIIVCLVITLSGDLEKNIIVLNSTTPNYILSKRKEIDMIAELTFRQVD